MLSSKTNIILSPRSGKTSPSIDSANGICGNADIIAELPYNPDNILISRREIESFLRIPDVLEETSTYETIKTKYNITDKKDIPLNVAVFQLAFVHQSYCTRKNENVITGNEQCPNNCLKLWERSYERLEFLGDSILGASIADYLYERYPSEEPGWYTNMKTQLVNGNMLSALCIRLGLNKYIVLSNQIDKNNGRTHRDITEDVLEAFIGAIYQNYGFDIAKEWIVNVVENHVRLPTLIKYIQNYKDKLVKLYQQTHQDKLQFLDSKVSGSTLIQVCIKTGDGSIIGVGKGMTKKLAEQQAAKKALVHHGEEVADEEDDEIFYTPF